MNNFLVIGGTGVMGTAAIKAIHEKFGDTANILANWYGKEVPGLSIEGADETLFGDINDPQVLEKIKAGQKINAKSITYDMQQQLISAEKDENSTDRVHTILVPVEAKIKEKTGNEGQP